MQQLQLQLADAAIASFTTKDDINDDGDVAAAAPTPARRSLDAVLLI